MSIRGTDWHDVQNALQAAGIDDYHWVEAVQGRFLALLFQAMAGVRSTNVIEVEREFHTNPATHALVRLLQQLVVAAIKDGSIVGPDYEEKVKYQTQDGLVNKDKVNADFLAGFYGEQP